MITLGQCGGRSCSTQAINASSQLIGQPCCGGHIVCCIPLGEQLHTSAGADDSMEQLS